MSDLADKRGQRDHESDPSAGGDPQQKSQECRDWQSLIEEQIAKLDLDNLPNKGQPLKLDANPYADPADEAAHRLLRNAGFTLPWIEDGRKIDQDLERARQDLRRAWQEYADLRDAQICAGHQWVEGAWQAALRDFRSRIEGINRDIRDYNLKVPSPALQKFSIRVDEELARWGLNE
jgi:DnaJ family protein C protein 28